MKKYSILVWGTGNVAKEAIENLKDCDILGFIETEKSKESYQGKKVYSIDEIPRYFDTILIASSYQVEIYNYCICRKIDMGKCCVLKRMDYVLPINIENNLKLARNIFNDRFYGRILHEFGVMDEDWIAEDSRLYTQMNTRPSMELNEKYYMRMYSDKNSDAGSISNYFWQDLWAARKIYTDAPQVHYDIGSRVDGFIAHLLSFGMQVNLIDIRPLNREVDGLNFTEADATNLDGIPDDSLESLSALCSLEHFGLGRYGDPIDPEACYKCFHAICKKVKSGGNIYLSVPVGKEHVEFNAHRIFFASTLIDAFSCCELVEYSCTRDGYIEYNVEIHKYDDDWAYGGAICGLFHFRKRW